MDFSYAMSVATAHHLSGLAAYGLVFQLAALE